MNIRRFISLCILLFVNLVVGFLYIQPSSIRTLLSNPDSETTLLRESTLVEKEITTNDTSIPDFPLQYNLTLNPRELCSTKALQNKGKLSLVIMVCTAVPNFLQRQTIRETWGTATNNNTGYVRLAFLVGSTNNATLQQQLERESLQFSDIIQQNFIDSYQNLTLKSLMLLRWVSELCPNVQYVLKTDDDMYVNVPNLEHTLTRLPVKSNVMYGVLFKKAKPNRNPSAKWYVPKNQFDGEMFPDYLSGTGYVMSRDVVPKILEASNTLPFLVMEDVFITGLCASQSSVKRYNVRGFAYWRRSATGCAFKDVITGHHVSVKDMIKIWKELQKRPLICRQKKKA